ncbi:MAG: pyridoxal-dependent decarboxylase [Candidatus Paceibacterota bacterium]
MREKLILNNDNKEDALEFFTKVVEVGVGFKLQKDVNTKHADSTQLKQMLVTELNEQGVNVENILDDFVENVLPYCTNFSSENFMGFPDAGNSIAGIGGAVMSDFLQQNLINQSFCAPSATFVEIAVIQWLRQTVGYTVADPGNVWDVGGIITPGGTSSNTIAMMLAREHHVPGTMDSGVTNPENFKIVVPKGIGHYSVKSAQRWLGCGNHLLEVPTTNFRYDISELSKVLKEHKGTIMAVVAYAGDSRTMTVDNLLAVSECVKSHDSKIWLHADACHGFSLGFSQSLKHKISGIELFDSISTDPHKVLAIPYTLSALLIKNPEALKSLSSISDLIMQEDFAFGQIIPFIGSKSWSSLKLWFMMKHFGRAGLDDLITKRHQLAQEFSLMVKNHPSFTLVNKVDINAVAFLYTNFGSSSNISYMNSVNRLIHDAMLRGGKYHLHQFGVPDPGVFSQGETIYPLRFMCGNLNLTTEDMQELLIYIDDLGKKYHKA